MFHRRIFIATAALGALGVLAGCKQDALHGVDLTDSNLGRGFSLQGSDGRAYTLADFQGKVVLIFFGFTQCPDVCPTALVRAAEIRQRLGERGKNLQVLFVTVDPERDTPDVLAAYVSAFDPSFIGLYGSLDQTRATAGTYKVHYEKVPTGSSYTMDHTALSYVHDAQGKLRVALSPRLTIDDVVSDIERIMDQKG